MSKVAILTDSNSGITQAQSKDMGVTVIPMPFLLMEWNTLKILILHRKNSMKSLKMMQIYLHHSHQ